MARKPGRTLRHRCFDGPAILVTAVGDLRNLLSLHTGPVAFDYATEKHFFKRSFPRFAEQAVKILSILLVGVLMSVTRKLVGMPSDWSTIFPFRE